MRPDSTEGTFYGSESVFGFKQIGIADGCLVAGLDGWTYGIEKLREPFLIPCDDRGNGIKIERALRQIQVSACGPLELPAPLAFKRGPPLVLISMEAAENDPLYKKPSLGGVEPPLALQINPFRKHRLAPATLEDGRKEIPADAGLTHARDPPRKIHRIGPGIVVIAGLHPARRAPMADGATFRHIILELRTHPEQPRYRPLNSLSLRGEDIQRPNVGSGETLLDPFKRPLFRNRKKIVLRRPDHARIEFLMVADSIFVRCPSRNTRQGPFEIESQGPRWIDTLETETDGGAIRTREGGGTPCAPVHQSRPHLKAQSLGPEKKQTRP
ncbi:MAG: hypothetical protein EBX52_05975 [Proteobacteria bacterium]|nr:hypothetical protein [Pseudomonadota bacterium]